MINQQDIVTNDKQQKKYTFKPGQSLPNQPFLIFKWLKILNNQQDSVILTNGQFKDMKFALVCEKLSKWSIKQQLTAYSNCQSRLLIIIKDISFPYLRSLNLWENNIESVQIISNFHMPNLEQLWIWRNKITSVQSLRRAHLPKLQTIDLKNNFILDHSPISEMYLKNDKIQRVDIGSPSLPLGLKDMAKFPSIVNLLYPYIYQKKKDDQLPIVLKKRFPQIIYY